MNIKLQPGPMKDFVWGDRQQIAADNHYLFRKFCGLTKVLVERGHDHTKARSLAMMFLAFPYRRTLRILDDAEMLAIISEIKSIVLYYESYCN